MKLTLPGPDSQEALLFITLQVDSTGQAVKSPGQPAGLARGGGQPRGAPPSTGHFHYKPATLKLQRSLTSPGPILTHHQPVELLPKAPKSAVYITGLL